MIGYAQPDIVGLNQGTDAGILVSKLAGTVYNLTYTILINLVLQAIVSGLIIDTFSSMREENEAIQADIKDKCFICSLSRYFFSI
jgi:ABC-type Fe3+-siderophore transport system permease subunit